MFKNLINSLFAETAAPAPSEGIKIEFIPTQFTIPIIGYRLPELLQKQFKSMGFPNIQFTDDMALIHAQNKAKKDMLLLFPVRLPDIGTKEFVKGLRDENPTLTTQLVVITDKFNKEELISLLRQRINGILLLPLTKSMIGTIFSKLNIIPDSLK